MVATTHTSINIQLILRPVATTSSNSRNRLRVHEAADDPSELDNDEAARFERELLEEIACLGQERALRVMKAGPGDPTAEDEGVRDEDVHGERAAGCYTVMGDSRLWACTHPAPGDASSGKLGHPHYSC